MNVPNELINPPKEFSLMPFWFWNDNLNEDEIIRQIDDFENHGVHGFTIHPRVGLPRNLGWMSDNLLDLYEVAIKEAQKRKMKVILYDEGMYPSGSSCGQVVESNSDFQCRCIAKIEHTNNEEYQLKNDENLISIIRDQKNIEYSIIDRKVDSSIRGLHYIDGGPKEDAPLAADILNPKAVDCFIDLVYKKFHERFESYFGETIIGIFTDEPNMLGKCKEKDVLPGTKNILEEINKILGYDFTQYLSFLWSDNPDKKEKYREIYISACSVLLEQTYYARIQKFCHEKNIPLTGHPSKGDDLGLLKYFDIPGQDLVWRWILPDTSSALEGNESTQAKCSSSAMIHGEKRRNLNEYCGAYGHEFSWEEMMWLGNWCIIRGVNLLVPHAFYYSIRGCRKDERPPDVGPNASWWNGYKEYADTFKRLCWINTDSTHICQMAILGQANKLPWKSAKKCFENQIDFNYIEERELCETAIINENGIQLAGMHYKGLIIEFNEGNKTKEFTKLLEDQNQAFRFNPSSSEDDLIKFSKTITEENLSFSPKHKGIRIRHVIKENIHFYLFFNETKESVTTTVTIQQSGKTHSFNLVTGNSTPIELKKPLEFQPHEMKVLLAIQN